ncbi:MAG: ABC transporter ATP-binding protein [Anaerolineae bacterium CG17_big_fil_post_rev_8_21_14_2_50_57_27]|nr:MAG: ABC transporter [Anaerolineae bacterium CG2_30_58_95]PIW17637.1 MAG: ABC transporter ATP-binding protein [Anaerolineae bacterium CG17_big_fil_post_rev_8_21_14_2_50_57_27]
MSSIAPTSTYFDFRQALTAKKMTGLWRMMSDYRLAYAAANLSLAVSALAKMFTYLLLRNFADTILGDAVPFAGTLERTLIVIALGFVGLAIVEGGFTYFSGRLAAYSAEGITRRLRNFLFDHIQRLSFAYHSKTPTGDLIERVTSDVDSVRSFFNEQAIGIGRIVFLFVINFAAIWQLNWKLALASIVVIPIILIVSLWFFKKVTKAYEKYQEQEALLSTTLQENLTGVRVVKAFARQEYEKAKFEKDNWEKFLRGKAFLRMHSLFWPLSDIACGFQMLGGFIYAAILAIHGEITVGTYPAYVGLVVWLIWPMRNLGRIIVQTSTGLVSYGRLMEIVKQEREPLTEGRVQAQGPARGEIVFENVSFQYEDSSANVIKDVSFRVLPGQSVALLGSTGSGKTSLVNLLPRFHEYTDGHILLDGAELKDYPRQYLRSQIGIVEQEPFLFSRSIGENITYGVGRDVPQEEIEAAAQAAAIHEVILTFPDGYKTLVGEKGVTLSGGQRQRMAIARTLLKNPRILILDDSTSSVDTETEAEIRAALNRLMENRTTFIIAHRIQSVMNADLILVMDKGAVVQMGRHEELVAQDGMYRQIYEIQTRIDTELEDELAKVG